MDSWIDKVVRPVWRAERNDGQTKYDRQIDKGREKKESWAKREKEEKPLLFIPE